MLEGKHGLFLAGPVALNHGRTKAPVFPFVVPWLGIQRDGARLLRDLGKIRVPDNWSEALVTSSRAAGEHLKAFYTLRPEVETQDPSSALIFLCASRNAVHAWRSADL